VNAMLKKILILIGAGYALVLILVLVLGLMTISSMDRLHSITTDLFMHPFTVNNAALEAQSNILWMSHYMNDVVTSNDPEEIGKLAFEIDERDKNVREKLALISERFLGNVDKVKDAERLLNEWKALRNAEIALIKQGKAKHANRISQGSEAEIFMQLNTDMDYIVNFTRQRAAAFDTEAEKEAQGQINLTWWLLGGIVASISLIGGGIVYRIFLLVRRQQQTDEDLKQYSAQLEASNLELESFSYSVSHDLRVPLRAVDGFSRILLEEYNDKLDAEGQRLLKVVRDNTKKMAQLIDDILSFSRSGRIELVPAEVKMDDLVRDVMAELSPATAGRKVVLEIKPMPPALADRSMMRRVLVNLLANAVKFTRPKAEAHIEIGAKTGTGETVYYVKDNGVGFDMKYVGKMFGMFLRLHGVEEFEGTGIGLAIVKRIITRHGGRVWAEGKVNEGATIYFTLPATPPPA
jgi:signal transduction histidine kinase